MSRRGRARRGLLTRWELGLGVVLFAAVAAYALPVLQHATWRTRRAEVSMHLSSLQLAERAWRETHGTWFELAPTPRGAGSVGRDFVPWPATLPGGWRPTTRGARCSYRSDGAGAELTLVAVCDVDGDGAQARYMATPDGRIRRLTPEEVY